MEKNGVGKNVLGKNVFWGKMSYGKKCHGEICHGEKCRGENCHLGKNVTEPFVTFIIIIIILPFENLCLFIAFYGLS